MNNPLVELRCNVVELTEEVVGGETLEQTSRQAARAITTKSRVDC